MAWHGAQHFTHKHFYSLYVHLGKLELFDTGESSILYVERTDLQGIVNTIIEFGLHKTGLRIK